MSVAAAERLWCGERNFAAEYFEGSPASSDGGGVRVEPGARRPCQVRRAYRISLIALAHV